MKEISELLKQFEDVYALNKVAQVQSQVEKVKLVAVQNLEAILQRGENVDQLIQQADELSTSTRVFYKSSKKLQKCGWASCEIL